jgi:hypothetical protein
LQATTDASAAPLGGQLVDVELVGLIVLFGAVIIAVVRVSLRTPRPAEAATRNVGEVPTQQPEASRQGWRHRLRRPRLRIPRMRRGPGVDAHVVASAETAVANEPSAEGSAREL